MTDLASLVLAVDSRQVKDGSTALDGLTAAGQRTERATQGVQREWVRASSEAGRLRMAAAGAAQDMDRATVSAGAHRAGMQQLGYQLGDAATMFAMGGNAAQIFASQLGQTLGAVQLMTGGTSKLAGFLGGPWGMAISTAAIVLVPFISKLFDSGEAADTAAKSYRSAAEEARGLIGAMNALALNQQRIDRNKLQEQVMGLENLLATGERAGGPNGTGRAIRERGGGFFDRYRQVAEVEQELRAARLELARADSLISIAEQGNRAVERSARSATGGGRSGGGGGGAARSAGRAAGIDYGQSFVDAASDLIAQNNAALIRGFDFDPAARMMGEAFEEGAALINGALAGTDEAFMRNVYEPARAAAEETQRLNDNLSDTVSLLMGMGGAGRSLGQIGAVLQGLTTGNTMNLPGKFGALVGLLDRSSDGGVSREFRSAIEAVFGDQGKFTKKLDSIFLGAGVGSAMGGVLFGGSKSAQTGSTIGGALGQAVAGPLGALAGSIIGGILGGVFKKTKTGSATIGQGDFGFEVTGTGGNSGSRKRAASGAANDIIGSIEQIADALGGSATGDASVSIGIRNKKFRVDTTGQGRTKGAGVLNFGKDQEAAMKAAIQDAIADGAIVGLRGTVQALLKGEGDLERQLQKALKLNSAFDDLAERTDPIAFAMGKLTEEFDALRRIATEAGASAAEMAQLEELLALRREEAAEDARQSVIDKIRDSQNLEVRLLELLGREEDALAATRLLELAGLKATLQPLQTMIYQLEDARAIIDKFGPLSEDLKAFKNELLGGQSSNSFAFLASQFRSVAGSAAGGDATALGKLRGVAGEYLDAARENAGSALEYQRALGEVLASVDKGIFAADSQVEYAQAQIDAINNTAGIIERMRAEMAVLQTQIVENTGFVARLWSRFEGEGLRVITDADTPLNVTVTA